MSLGKLGMLLFLEYRSGLGVVKNHLSKSVYELLKAMEETLHIVEKSNQQVSIHPLQETILAKIVSPLQLLLHYSETKCAIPKSASASDSASSSVLDSLEKTAQLKDHIVNTLIAALDNEIRRTSASTAVANPLKIEALQAVRGVLLEHIAALRPATEADVPMRHEAIMTFKTDSRPASLQVEMDHTDHIMEESDTPLSFEAFQEVKTA